MKTTELFGIQVANATMEEAAEYLGDLALEKKPCYVGGLNINQLLLINNNHNIRRIYEQAGMVFPDGQPILWMARNLKRPLVSKLSGPDLMVELCKIAAEKALRVYFLGGAQGSPEKASEILKRKFPKLIIAGTYSPPFGFEKVSLQMRNLIFTLYESKADILFVGLGSPKQDIFIADNMIKYNIPVSLSVGIGIDFIAGNVKRAPKWMRDCGLEWFHRMLQDPKRLVKRYLVDDLKVIGIYRRYKRGVKHEKSNG